MIVDGISTIRYLTTASFGFGASGLLGEVLAELAIALDGVERAARWIEEATSNGRSRPARWNMMMASMEGALTFQKGLGAVHAMAHPLGALEALPLHHGTLNAVLLPAVLRFNEPAAPEKYERLRRVIALGTDVDLAGWVADLNARLGLPDGLAAMGVPPQALPRIAEHAEQDPATETNARPPTRADYNEMLRAAMALRQGPALPAVGRFADAGPGTIGSVR